MKKFLYLSAALFVSILSSCTRDFQELSFSGIENVKVTKMSREGVEAEITARIKNPNATAFTIYRSALDVTLNGISCGKAHITNNVRINGNSESAYLFKIRSDLSSLSMADLPKILSMAMSKNASIALKGNLKAGKFFFKREYPVEYSRSVNLEGF